MRRRAAIVAGVIYGILTATGYWLARSNPSDPSDPEHDWLIGFYARALDDPVGAQRLWEPIHELNEPIPDIESILRSC